jgi:hypothetical protein
MKANDAQDRSAVRAATLPGPHELPEKKDANAAQWGLAARPGDVVKEGPARC